MISRPENWHYISIADSGQKVRRKNWASILKTSNVYRPFWEPWNSAMHAWPTYHTSFRLTSSMKYVLFRVFRVQIRFKLLFDINKSNIFWFRKSFFSFHRATMTYNDSQKVCPRRSSTWTGTIVLQRPSPIQVKTCPDYFWWNYVLIGKQWGRYRKI